MTPLCSILLPSLGRFDKLLAAVRSFYETADDSENFEILLRLHLSDKPTWNHAHSSELLRSNVKILWAADKSVGATNEVLWNDLLPLATGTWLQFWSDDMTIFGAGWDTKLMLEQTSGCVVHPEIHQLNESIYEKDNRGPVPFIPRAAMEMFKDGIFHRVPDVAIPNVLIGQCQWRVRFLTGIGVKHDRVEDATTRLANAS